jgi:hypothetical protein
VIVAAVWFGESGFRRIPVKAVETPSVTHQENASMSNLPTRPLHHDRRPNEAQRQELKRRPTRDSSPVNTPMLEQFPSPTPLNEQEKMLARYVEEFPQKAVLVARAQTDLQKQNQREMAAPWPKNAESSSDQ